MIHLHGDLLESRVIRILSSKPHCSAEQLRIAASSGGKTFSPAAVYKVLDRLLSDGVIVKTGAFYSLSLGWIFDIFSFSERLSATYFSESYLRTLVPRPGNRQTWRFSQLIRCNEFWNQLLLALVKETPGVPAFAWVPCPWFIMLQQGRESRLQQVFKMSGRRFYTSFRSFGRLDAHIRKAYKARNQTISFADSPFKALKNQYLDVIGDYVLNVTLDPSIAHKLEHFCQGKANKDSEVRARELTLLTERCKATITLECSPKKAARLRADFETLFDLSL